MQTLLYDTTTKTVLEVNDDTYIYVNPDPFTVEDLKSGSPNPASVFVSPLRIFPTEHASPSALYGAVTNTQTYLRELTATAGRALLLRLARRIEDLHDGTRLIDLRSLYLGFTQSVSNNNNNEPTYQIDSLAGPRGVVVMSAESMQMMIEEILGDVPEFTLNQLAVHIDGQNTRAVRLPDMSIINTLTWNPDDPHGLPEKIVVALPDLLEINQRV